MMINYDELIQKYKRLGITDLPTREMIDVKIEENITHHPSLTHTYKSNSNCS